MFSLVFDVILRAVVVPKTRILEQSSNIHIFYTITVAKRKPMHIGKETGLDFSTEESVKDRSSPNRRSGTAIVFIQGLRSDRSKWLKRHQKEFTETPSKVDTLWSQKNSYAVFGCFRQSAPFSTLFK